MKVVNGRGKGVVHGRREHRRSFLNGCQLSCIGWVVVGLGVWDLDSRRG